jgi:DNA (cytosine-5)-methyltransferase 1
MYLREWYQDVRLEGYITNHESRGHIRADLHRYLYYSSYAKVVGKSPTAVGLPKILWPQHKNFDSGKFADRFRVQISDLPATTITSHISKDGHYFIHYDPIQCRSLTVREAARVQTFPDNYHFVGTRTQQYVQVGNAVPPILAHKLAKVVALILAL